MAATRVGRSPIHGLGLFATCQLTDHDLGPYSTDMVWGDEAEDLLLRMRRRGGRDVVVCTDVPRGHEDRERDGSIFPPYVLRTDRACNLCRINQAATESVANTRINRDGTFTVVRAAPGEELLTWYGRSYGRL